MSDCRDLAAAVRRSAALFMRFTPGFEAHPTTQPNGLPNHYLWTLGHLAFVMQRAADRIERTDTDLDWDVEPYAVGSEPVDDPGQYPPLDEMLARFDRGMERFAASIERLDESDLDRQIDWGHSAFPVRDLILRMVFHNGIHAGQLIDARRALDLGRVIG